METSSKEIHGQNWQLFKSVRLLFASDIPWHGGYSTHEKISIENDGNMIQNCMREIPIHVREPFDTLDVFTPILTDDLQPFLCKLQELVHDKIMEEVGVAVSKSMNGCIYRSVQ